MFRYIKPESPQQLRLRMLFQPAANGLFHRASEADSYRGLVAAVLNDPSYETAAIGDRLRSRIRAAADVILVNKIDGRVLRVTDHDADDAINVHTDEEFIRSLERVGFLSVHVANPSVREADDSPLGKG